MTENSPVEILNGVGAKRGELLHRLGIFTVRDLLYHFPAGYQERGKVNLLCDAPSDEYASVVLTVGTKITTARLPNRKTVSKFDAYDASGVCRVTYFNRQHPEFTFPLGSTHRFWGKVEKNANRYLLTSPENELLTVGHPLRYFVPRYPLTAGLSHRDLARMIEQALDLLSDADFADPLPYALRERYRLPSVYRALCDIHRPLTVQDSEKAKQRFLLEQLYPFCLGVARSQKADREETAPVMPLSSEAEQRFLQALPYTPTGAQKKAMAEISADLAPSTAKEVTCPMHRILCGDVGSGKTLCAAHAAYQCLENGFQCAIMAPTEILAQQHYNSLAPMFEAFGYTVGLLTGSVKPSAQKKVRASVANGEIRLLIGTHALISESTVYQRLGLVITDEQHRFGVMQRTLLAEKAGEHGLRPHILVMSATPIPRSLSLILYGDLAMSALRELPPGRQTVDTAVIDEAYRTKLNNFIRRQVKEGSQVYVVCPAVEDPPPEQAKERSFYAAYPREGEQNDNPIRSVTSHAAYLKNEALPDLRIEILHGKMPPDQKDEIMARFARHEIDVLVATTVIEVGINVPNATLMVVENAERFGLSQLHQLRGRVGRGQRKSYCVLVSSSESKTANQRLSALKNTTDGFEIAETDLRLRGPGDYLPSPEGTIKQHGDFRLLALCDNVDTLKEIFDFANAVIEHDPLLLSEENRLSKELSDKMFLPQTGVIH